VVIEKCPAVEFDQGAHDPHHAGLQIEVSTAKTRRLTPSAQMSAA
jgi:hypothetical protein